MHGESATITGTVTAVAVPADGRQLSGELAIVTTEGAIVGRGNVTIGAVNCDPLVTPAGARPHVRGRAPAVRGEWSGPVGGRRRRTGCPAGRWSSCRARTRPVTSTRAPGRQHVTRAADAAGNRRAVRSRAPRRPARCRSGWSAPTPGGVLGPPGFGTLRPEAGAVGRWSPARSVGSGVGWLVTGCAPVGVGRGSAAPATLAAAGAAAPRRGPTRLPAGRKSSCRI